MSVKLKDVETFLMEKTQDHFALEFLEINEPNVLDLDFVEKHDIPFIENKTTGRREEFIISRKALAKSFTRLNRQFNLSDITFPAKDYSITHSRGQAFAIATTSESIEGLGIDFESDRLPQIGSERFFLNSVEQKVFSLIDESQKQSLLLNLWMIKEAVFKADLLNQNQALKDYILDDITKDKGVAFHRDRPERKLNYYLLTIDENKKIAISFYKKEIGSLCN